MPSKKVKKVHKCPTLDDAFGCERCNVKSSRNNKPQNKRTALTVDQLIGLLEMIGDQDMLVEINGEPITFVERKNSVVVLHIGE
jgi:hypothetical protein